MAKSITELRRELTQPVCCTARSGDLEYQADVFLPEDIELIDVLASADDASPWPAVAPPSRNLLVHADGRVDL